MAFLFASLRPYQQQRWRRRQRVPSRFSDEPSFFTASLPARRLIGFLSGRARSAPLANARCLCAFALCVSRSNGGESLGESVCELTLLFWPAEGVRAAPVGGSGWAGGGLQRALHRFLSISLDQL